MQSATYASTNKEPGVSNGGKKWSFPVEGGLEAGLLTGDWPTGDWVAVQKRRLNTPFALDGENAHPVGAEEEGQCSLEVSELTVNAACWWSVCFEVYHREEEHVGNEERLTDAVLGVAAYTFAQGQPPVLSPEESMGYPAWLQCIG